MQESCAGAGAGTYEPRRDDVDVQIVSPREVQAHDKLPPKRKVTLAPWSLATSSFAPYRVDTASSIKAAFEVDYGLTNLSKLLGSPNAAAEDSAARRRAGGRPWRAGEHGDIGAFRT